MKRLALITTALVMLTPHAHAQTAVGVGVAKSDSTAIAGSKAVAISGQGGAGGTGGNPSARVTINSTVPSATTATVNNEGTSTVKNVPSVFAPGLAAAGLETCLGSVSGGGAFVGTGFSFGTTIPDPGCAARLDARTLWSMGLKKAAVARLCLNPDISRAMPEVCGTYLPQPAAYGVAVAAPTYYYEEGTYPGGPIMLLEGKTGAQRLCQDYDEPKHHCRVWDGDSRVVSHHKRKPVVASAPAVQPPPPQAEAKQGTVE